MRGGIDAVAPQYTMKILILSITAGEGHNSTAAAIQTCVAAHGDTAEVFDAYRYVSKALYEIVKQGYLLVSKDFKTLFAKSYALAENRRAGVQGGNSIYRIANLQLTKKLSKYIRQYAPDAIIYTHPFLGVVTDLMKTRNDINIPMIGVVTDYTVHPLWEEARSTDRIVIANDLLRSQLLRKGIRDDRIAPIGIPIRSVFSEKMPKERARALLGLENKFTLLLMGGSMGYGDIAGVVEELDAIQTDFQIISVCGNNATAKEAIDALNTKKRVLNLGFTKEVDRLMDASDVIVTKPGGLTTSEALAKELPIIICNPIPGHERRNASFLLNNGAAMEVDKHIHFEDVFWQLMHNPARVDCFHKATAALAKPHATEDLYLLTRDLVQEYAKDRATVIPEILHVDAEKANK